VKVLHAISSLNASSGGPIEALLGLVRAQIGLGLSVRVLSSWNSKEPNIALELQGAGATIENIDRHSLVTSKLSKMWSAIRAVDVVHVHGLWEVLPTVTAGVAWRLRVPYVIRPCGMLDSWSLAQNQRLKRLHLWAITRPLLSQATLIHATSDRERDEVLGLGLGTRTIVLPNGVDEVAFEEPSLTPVQILDDIRKEARIVLFLGRVHPKKGFDVLLPAMLEVRTPGVVLVIVGPREDVHATEIRRQVELLGLSNRVRMLGAMYDSAKYDAYSCAEVFVLPSKQENFAITTAEAMARRLPVVLSHEVALSDLVLQHDAGLVVKRDATALANAIDDLLADAQMRRRMGEAGRRLAELHFRWSSIAEKWQSTYAALARTTDCS